MTDIHLSSSKGYTCICGAALRFCRPEDIESVAPIAKAAGELLIPLGESSCRCPECGRGYILPSVETFDPERSPAWSLVEALRKSQEARKSDNYQPPDPGDPDTPPF